MDVSVVITVFNQPIESVSATIRSVVAQRGCNYEILIADDCSDIDLSQQITELFSELSFSRFKIIRHKQNYKTVLNVRNALLQASGEYMKLIGSGDLLYDDSTLSTLVSFMRSRNVNVGFGKVIAFKKDGASIKCYQYKAPSNPQDYYVGGMDRGKAFKRQLDMADWIPGGSQFFKTEKAIELYGILAKDFGVRYCEDFAGTIALIDSEVAYLDSPILWYDFGDGISTSGHGASRLYNDHACFYKGISSSKPFSKRFVLARMSFAVRKTIALKTPLYRFLQTRFANSLQNGDGVEPNRFLLDIVGDVY